MSEIVRIDALIVNPYKGFYYENKQGGSLERKIPY